MFNIISQRFPNHLKTNALNCSYISKFIKDIKLLKRYKNNPVFISPHRPLETLIKKTKPIIDELKKLAEKYNTELDFKLIDHDDEKFFYDADYNKITIHISSKCHMLLSEFLILFSHELSHHFQLHYKYGNFKYKQNTIPFSQLVLLELVADRTCFYIFQRKFIHIYPEINEIDCATYTSTSEIIELKNYWKNILQERLYDDIPNVHNFFEKV
jgi:hypothetical protein